MSDERYVVKLACGNYLVTSRGGTAARQRDAGTFTRDEAYRSALTHGAVALRLKPSARAAELAKLRAEVTELEGKLDAMTDRLHAVTKERDALAAKLAEMTQDRNAIVAQFAAQCPAPARPVEELRDELVKVWRTTAPVSKSWDAVAKRARELGAR